MKNNSEIEIYQSTDGNTEVQVTFENDTVWLSLTQMAELFGRDKSVVSRHLRNIYKEGELEKAATIAKNATVQIEGQREIKRDIEFYNLDAIISVGYRVNSKQGTQFRIWATNKLKEYLVYGYAINKTRLEQTNQEVHVLRAGIQILGRVIEEKAQEEGLGWLTKFTKGLTLLDDFDHERLDSKGLSLEKAKYPARQAYQALINQMKLEFESDVFGLEKDQSFESAIAQVSKGFGQQDFYPSIEEKAATLLYLIIKNHAFADGNKRIAAACFLLFLENNQRLYKEDGTTIISNEALASITLFAAASKPEEMDVVKKLIVSILNRNKN